ncbi:mogroside IE synthase-like [Rosa rugosa]|uniref:mogroside IE synthase-like n=1 Tax=Rosa rugosa TaxID=74645 RepID=UPI002B40B7B2|nr:mogroside IE synthase-like [Rosa rugosa]
MEEMNTEKEEQTGAKQSHILVFSFPVQGHINPMLEFSKRLASKGQRVTLVTTTKASKSLQVGDPITSFGCNLKVEFISDGTEQADQGSGASKDLFELLKSATTKSLAKLITNIKNSNDATEKYPLKFLVYDYIMPWALDVARQHGMDGAPFYPTSSGVAALYYQFLEGTLKLPLREGQPATLPSMPPLELNDLPTFLSDLDLYPLLLKLTAHIPNLREVKWIFHTTFDKLESEVLESMASHGLPVRAIGPTVPSMFLDKRLEDDKDYGLNLLKPDEENCMKWLDSKETGSVVYASFGSLSNLSKEEVEELASCLTNCSYYFLWVVRETEKEKLPEKFLDEITRKGLVVSWCKQLSVLAHKAVGCFVTHCGWNSTLEALSLGVPMVGLVAVPDQFDHPTIAKYVADVWKARVRVKVNEKVGFATRGEIAMCIRHVMDKEKGMEVRNASLVWKELAKEAMYEGGSSDKNIEEFVAALQLI